MNKIDLTDLIATAVVKQNKTMLPDDAPRRIRGSISKCPKCGSKKIYEVKIDAKMNMIIVHGYDGKGIYRQPIACFFDTRVKLKEK